MEPSIKDQAKGKSQEVKGKIKEKVGKATITRIWRSKVRTKTQPARFRRKSARLKKF